MTNNTEQNISPTMRPVALSLLCIITFIAGTVKIVLFLWAILRSNPDYSGKENDINGLLNVFLGINSTFYLILWIVVTITAIAGAVLMWKLKKSGFYIYTLSVCIAYILPSISEGPEMMTIQRLFFTTVFIFFYGIHLKFMN